MGQHNECTEELVNLKNDVSVFTRGQKKFELGVINIGIWKILERK
jgi:hypothetical protein